MSLVNIIYHTLRSLVPLEENISVSLLPLLKTFYFLTTRSGIQNGDVIVKVNGIPLKTTNDLQEAVKNEFPLLLEVRRGNEDILFNIEPDLIG